MPVVNQFGQPVLQGGGYRIGRIISHVFHPTLIGLASLLVVGGGSPESPSVRQGLLWALACFAVILVPPAIYFYWRLLDGHLSDHDLSRRSERRGLYLVTAISAFVGTAILYQFGLPGVFLRMLSTGVLVTVFCMLINIRWKISVHSAAIATLSMLASIFLPPIGLCVWFCVVAVGWARIRTGNHTILQVLGGCGVAVLAVLLTFGLGRW